MFEAVLQAVQQMSGWSYEVVGDVLCLQAPSAMRDKPFSISLTQRGSNYYVVADPEICVRNWGGLASDLLGFCTKRNFATDKLHWGTDQAENTLLIGDLLPDDSTKNQLGKAVAELDNIHNALNTAAKAFGETFAEFV